MERSFLGVLTNSPVLNNEHQLSHVKLSSEETSLQIQLTHNEHRVAIPTNSCSTCSSVSKLKVATLYTTKSWGGSLYDNIYKQNRNHNENISCLETCPLFIPECIWKNKGSEEAEPTLKKKCQQRSFTLTNTKIYYKTTILLFRKKKPTTILGKEKWRNKIQSEIWEQNTWHFGDWQIWLWCNT